MHNPAADAIADALPIELRPHAGDLAALLADLNHAALVAQLTARPVLAAALAALVGQSLAIEGRSLLIAGNVGTLQQVTISGGYVDQIIGTAITIQLPPTPKHIDLAAAQELLVALPIDTLPPPAPLPAIQRMPLARNPLFVGREADLHTLALALKGEQGALAIGPAAATTGLGGIGKTNLASEFVHRYGTFFAGGVFWLSFADPSGVPVEVAACGAALELPGFADLKLDDQVARVLASWASPLPRLLVFDNCEDESLLQEWRPTSGGCRVLVTSRRGQWSASLGVASLPLGVLSRAESIGLLRKHRPDLAENDASLHAIAAELGDLPLALHLAGSYLETYRDSAACGDPVGFLAELRDAKLLDHEAMVGVDVTPSPTNHDLHVGRTFALSYGRLDTSDPANAQALTLLARTAHLAPGEPIPRELLLITLEIPKDDRAALRSAERGLLRLIALGLIERAEDGALRLHRLVGSYVRHVSGDAAAQAAAERVVTKMALLINDEPTLALISILLPIIRGITDAALPREDAAAAALSLLLGRHLDRLGGYALAQQYVERALDINERVLGEDHAETISSMHKLAELYRTQGGYAAARPLYERALANSERTFGAHHRSTATILGNLAALYDYEGNYVKARPLCERALSIYESVAENDHAQSIGMLSNLAALLRKQGQYTFAHQRYNRALAIAKREFGPDHPHYAQCLNGQAELFRAQKNYVRARPLYEQAIAIAEHALGLNHPKTAEYLNNFAIVCFEREKYQQARELYDRSRVITERIFGSEHPNTATLYNNIAGLHERLGSYTEAEQLYQQALAIRWRLLGPHHSEVATSLHNLAGLFAKQRHYAVARDLYQHALVIRQQALGSEHHDTVATKRLLERLP